MLKDVLERELQELVLPEEAIKEQLEERLECGIESGQGSCGSSNSPVLLG